MPRINIGWLQLHVNDEECVFRIDNIFLREHEQIIRIHLNLGNQFVVLKKNKKRIFIFTGHSTKSGGSVWNAKRIKKSLEPVVDISTLLYQGVLVSSQEKNVDANAQAETLLYKRDKTMITTLVKIPDPVEER